MQELHIERLGQRGEGIARTPDGPVYVPYALAGETILAEVRASAASSSKSACKPGADRSLLPYYGICGGCAVQTLAAEPYAEWKRGLLVDALRHAGLTPPVDPLINAHGEGRRRATFHARYETVTSQGRLHAGARA